MKKFNVIIIVAAMLTLAALCACSSQKTMPVISNADVSAADASGSDISASDIASDADVHWSERLSEEDMVLANVIVSSTDAFNAENLEAYMDTIDPQSEVYDATIKSASDVFECYQLYASIDDIEVLSRDDNTAVLLVTQTTIRPEEGKTFYPTQAVLEHKLVCRDGVWYISKTLVKSSKELVEDRWDLFEEFAALHPDADTDSEDNAVG